MNITGIPESPHPTRPSPVLAILLCFLLMFFIPAGAIAQEASAEQRWQEAIAEGIDLMEVWDPVEAEKKFRTAVDVALGFGDADLRLFEARVRLLEACIDAETYTEADNLELLAQIDTSRDLVRDNLRDSTHENVTRFAELLQLQGSNAAAMERPEANIRYHEAAIEVLQNALGDRHESVASAHRNLAWAFLADGKLDAARHAMNRGLELAEQNPKASVEFIAHLVESSADLYQQSDEGETRAIAEMERSLALTEKAWGALDARYLDALARVGTSVRSWDDSGFSVRLLQRAAELSRRKYGARSVRYAEALHQLADAYVFAESPSEAEAHYLSATDLFRRSHLATAPEQQTDQLSQCLFDLSKVYQAREEMSQAIELQEEALANLPPDSTTEEGRWQLRYLANSLRSSLAVAYARSRKVDDADRHFQTFASLNRTNRPTEVGDLALSLGTIYAEQGDYHRAVPLLEEAVAAQEFDTFLNPMQRLEPMQRLAQVYLSMGRAEDANRMNFAIIGLSISSMVSAAGGEEGSKLLMGMFLSVTSLAAFIGILASIGFWQARKGLLQHIEVLYLPAVSPAPPPPPPALPPPPLPCLAADPPSDALPETSAAQDVPAEDESVDLLPSASFQSEEIPRSIGLSAAELAAAFANFETSTALQASTEGNEFGEFLDGQVLNPAPPASAPVTEFQSQLSANTSFAAMPPLTMAFHGDGATLFAIRVRNLLLTMLTMGGYSFWGKARVRRYLLGQIGVDGHRLAFHGTGKELLFGWLRAAPFLALIIFLPNVLPLLWETPAALISAQIVALAAIMLLVPIARAGAYRYRLNRTSWRGLRFSYRGSTLRFLFLYLRGYLLIPATLGIYAPFFHVRTERLLLNGSTFGDGKFQFSGKGRRLLPCFVCAVPLGILSLGLFWPWYRALRSRYCWACTTFGDARFRSSVTGFGLLRLWSGNLAILVVTLGLGSSWTTTRTLGYWSRHLEVVGSAHLQRVRQDPQAAVATGETFADFLGFDFGV